MTTPVLEATKTLTPPDHCLSAHQLRRHVLHLHQVQECLRGSGSVPRLLALQRHMAAFPGLVRLHRLLHHGIRRRLPRLPAWEMECVYLLVLIYHDRGVPALVYRVEAVEEDKVVEAARGGPAERC